MIPPTVDSTCTRNPITLLKRITFNQDPGSIWSSGGYLRWFLCILASVGQCTVGWILTDLAHKYLWCSDIFRTSKELPHAVNCVNYYCSQQNRKPLERKEIFLSFCSYLISHLFIWATIPHHVACIIYVFCNLSLQLQYSTQRSLISNKPFIVSIHACHHWSYIIPYIYMSGNSSVMEELLRSFTEVKVSIPPCKTTQTCFESQYTYSAKSK